MDTAGFPEYFEARAQVQVVGIAQTDLRADIVAEFMLVYSLHRGGGTYGHKYGRLDFSVAGRDESGARA
jgi:hypothetical protein